MMGVRILITLLITSTLFPALSQEVAEKLNSYQATHHQEKIYISSDKPYYSVGDTVWAKVYYLDAKTHKFFDLAPIVNVEWIDPSGKIEKSIILKIENGTSAFEIPIDQSKTGGNYVIRAYTQYQKNFDLEFIFQKTVKVYDKNIVQNVVPAKSPLKIKFYPEGGDLVSGLNNRVAFEVSNITEQDINLVGKIIDEEGREILNVSTLHEGIGVFDFLPEKGKKYNFHSAYDNKDIVVPLPESLPSGFTLNINGANKRFISLKIEATDDLLVEGTTILGHVRGEIFMEELLSHADQNIFKIVRDQVPSGILHFTLFNPEGDPVCERLTFNRNPTERIGFDNIVSESLYTKRQEVKVDLGPSQNNELVPAELTISVFNKDLFRGGKEMRDIVSYLLLNSDLPIDIPNAKEYITNKSASTNYLLDLMLMTRTWRRFNWQDVLKREYPKFKYGTQEDIQFVGKVKKRNKEETIAANVSLFAIGENLINSKVETGDDGIFYFKGFHFTETTDVFLQAHITEKKKKRKRKSNELPDLGSNKVDIELVNIDTIPFVLNKAKIKSIRTDEDIKKEIIIQQEILKWGKLATADLSVEIEEVTIKENRLKSQEERNQELRELLKKRGIRYTNLTQKFYMENMPGAKESYDIYNLITTVIPKLAVRGGGAVERHLTQKLGTSVSGNLSGENGNRYAGIPVLINHRNLPNHGMQVDPQKIFAIEAKFNVFTGAIIYVNVISKEIDDLYRDKKRGTITISHPGYYQAREFYQPNYKVDNTRRSLDRRSTLYWNSKLVIGNSSESISFYTGDVSGTYEIFIEGITKSGIPFVHEQEIIVN